MLTLHGKDSRRSNYRLLGLVGQGQFGRVFCAVHRQTGQIVALKSLERERFSTHKFLRELRFLLSLEHPNIVMCQTLEHTATGRHLVMDYCEGGTLRTLMQDEVRLSMAHGIKLVCDVLQGLAHAHAQDIVHCDIKPENILLKVEEHGWTACISDFGIARLTQEVTEPYAGLGNTGSPAYMAPERFYGQYSAVSDLYSVGVLLFEMLAGDRPFSGTPKELMSAHLNQVVSFPAQIAPGWHSVLLRALQKLPARRFRTAEEMRDAVYQAAQLNDLDLASLGIHSASTSSPLLECHSTVPKTPIGSVLAMPLDRMPTQMMAMPAEADGESRVALIQPFPDVVTLYQAIGSTIAVSTHPTTSEGSRPPQQETIQLPEPVTQLLPHPHGCVAIASHSILLIHRTDAGAVRAKPLASFQQSVVATVEPTGRWLAVGKPNVAQQDSAQQDSAQQDSAMLLLPLHHPFPITLAKQSISLPQRCLHSLIALDSRHVAAFSDVASTSHSSVNTAIDVYTRRGTQLVQFSTALMLKQVVATSFPYRLLAADMNDAGSLLLIDLKPYRLTRIGLPVVPTLFHATRWGYVVADTHGEVVLLDEYGDIGGRIAIDEPIEAIAPFEPYGLLVATRQANQGRLLTVNLKTLETNFMF
ncbi:serine/threonine-protein kinase [Leptolyngbya sp. AN02str]|uniref:serine/threonine-protein kinase n=1 Tax=Leptolyngbya sp. AN02str TaxID=3423363 RepID=UPI003D321548